MRSITILLLAAACRPTLGLPRYPERVRWVDTGDEFLEGTDPYEFGEERLSLGAFYEGPFSEEVVVDDTIAHYYIYDGTYSQSESDDRVEGLVSDALTLSILGWFGGGIHWDNPTDLSAWTTLHLSAKAEDPVFESFTFGMTSADGAEARILATDYGFAADGEWHAMAVPLADLALVGLDVTQVNAPLQFIGDMANEGSVILIDDVYVGKE